METEELKPTEDLKDKVEDLASHAGDYIKTFYKLAVLTAAQKATTIGAGVFSILIICTLGLLALFFASVGAAWWLGNIIGSRTGGFLLIAGFYFLLVLCFVALRRNVVFPFIRNSIIKKIYE